MVLRVDSPGGDALASDLMWRELRLLAAEKPVVASMADVAASGGYYMAMACNKIVAEELTLTGSIGVVTGKFNFKELFQRVRKAKRRMSMREGAGSPQQLEEGAGMGCYESLTACCVVYAGGVRQAGAVARAVRGGGHRHARFHAVGGGGWCHHACSQSELDWVSVGVKLNSAQARAKVDCVGLDEEPSAGM